MATEYAFVDDSGTTRLEGFLVPEPGGSSSPLSEVTEISSAQLLASFTSPIVVLPDPGAGKVVIPWSLSCVSHSGAAVYTLAGGMALTGDSLFNLAATGVAAVMASFPPLISFDFWANVLGGAFDPSTHAAVTLAADTGNPTDGDFAITATFLYYLLLPT